MILRLKSLPGILEDRNLRLDSILTTFLPFPAWSMVSPMISGRFGTWSINEKLEKPGKCQNTNVTFNKRQKFTRLMWMLRAIIDLCRHGYKYKFRLKSSTKIIINIKLPRNKL